MSNDLDKAYWIWLSCVPGIGAIRFNKLLEKYATPRAIWNIADYEIKSLYPIIGNKAVQEILKRRTNKYLDMAFNILDTPDIYILTLEDWEYPQLLKTIYDPPPVLYCKGKMLSPKMTAIAVVGSRKATGYGRQMAEMISHQLSKAGITVISGLAMGIDAMAHKGALGGEGGTVAILGSGIDVIYPQQNKKLYKQIEHNGTVISEYPPGTKPLAGNFPARNRIISGLSQAVLVIEAGVGSGALITVDFALEQGREVFALPGNINNPNSLGTNNILKEGAKLVTCVDDILEEISIGSTGDFLKPSPKEFQLDFLETKVYEALEDQERDIEELAEITNISPAKLNGILTIMEIKGIVKQMPGKIFIRNWTVN